MRVWPHGPHARPLTLALASLGGLRYGGPTYLMATAVNLHKDSQFFVAEVRYNQLPGQEPTRSASCLV